MVFLLFVMGRSRPSVPVLLFGNAALLLSVLIRPTVVLLVVLASICGVFKAKPGASRTVSIAATVVLTIGIFMISAGQRNSPFHTMYVGLGAYPNQVGVNVLADEEGYRYFKQQSGIEIQTAVIGGNYSDPEIRSAYFGCLRNRYIDIVRSEPWLVMRNALFNVCQAFGIGYSVQYPVVSVISGVIGLAVIIVLVLRHLWLQALAIGAYSVTYIWYYPPIPAYHFGAFLITVVALVFTCTQGSFSGRLAKGIRSIRQTQQ